MNNLQINKMASVVLTEPNCERFSNFLTAGAYNSARLVIDKKLMSLDNQQQQLKMEGIKDPMIDFKVDMCNKIYDHTVNQIEVSLVSNERANGRQRNTKRAIRSSR